MPKTTTTVHSFLDNVSLTTSNAVATNILGHVSAQGAPPMATDEDLNEAIAEMGTLLKALKAAQAQRAAA